MARVRLVAGSTSVEAGGGGAWFKLVIELSCEVNACLALVAVGLHTYRVSLIMQKPVPRGTTMKHLKKNNFKMLLSQKKIQASDNYGYESKPSLIFSDIFQDYSYC